MKYRSPNEPLLESTKKTHHIENCSSVPRTGCARDVTQITSNEPRYVTGTDANGSSNDKQKLGSVLSNSYSLKQGRNIQLAVCVERSLSTVTEHE